MIRIPSSRARFAVLAAALVLTASGAHGVQQAGDRAPADGAAAAASTPAALMFPDAPDGVDPIVTGPVSAEFRARRKAAGCEAAEWPHVPVACYPD